MEDVQRNDSSVQFYAGLPSLSCLLMLFYWKFNEILGRKEQDTSWNIPGKTVVINVVFTAHKMFHEKSSYVFYFLTTSKNHFICPWST